MPVIYVDFVFKKNILVFFAKSVAKNGKNIFISEEACPMAERKKQVDGLRGDGCGDTADGWNADWQDFQD